jgi:hypothetical protein
MQLNGILGKVFWLAVFGLVTLLALRVLGTVGGKAAAGV